jgi:phosphoglycerate dehydrogenase-like enzyme
MSNAQPHVVVAEPLSDSALSRLAEAVRVTMLDTCTPEVIARSIPDASGLIVRSYSRVDAGLMDAAPRLRVIGRAGAGLENIDLEAAHHRNITVVYRPAAASDAVAEFTLGLYLALERFIVESSAMVRNDRFLEARSAHVGQQVGQRTFGIIGLGRIGSRLGRILHRAFDAKILFSDIRDITPDFPATQCDLDSLLAQADVVTLHVPLTRRTTHLIDRGALASMQRGALLINTARGAVLDAAAVSEALHHGSLGGAAVDVFEPEPPALDHPLLTAPRCLLTAHSAARTRTALTAMNDVVDDVLAVLSGQSPTYPMLYEDLT